MHIPTPLFPAKDQGGKRKKKAPLRVAGHKGKGGGGGVSQPIFLWPDWVWRGKRKVAGFRWGGKREKGGKIPLVRSRPTRDRSSLMEKKIKGEKRKREGKEKRRILFMSRGTKREKGGGGLPTNGGRGNSDNCRREKKKEEEKRKTTSSFLHAWGGKGTNFFEMHILSHRKKEKKESLCAQVGKGIKRYIREQ